MTLNLNGSTGISGVDGSAGTPAIQGTDANTGISFPAADTVAINTGGSERSRVDSSGRLLVGTSSGRTVGFSSLQAPVQVETSTAAAYTAVNNTNDANGCYISIAKTRGTSAGAVTAVQNNDELGAIRISGSDGTGFAVGAQILAAVDGTPGTNDLPTRLVFSTTTDGASSPTERVRIDNNGEFFCYRAYSNTTVDAANVNINAQGRFNRSSSSIKYKTNVETLQDSYADAILQCRPVWFRSTCAADNPNYSYWGFIAEEVATIDPRLVHWKTVEITYDEKGSVLSTPCDPEPEGVAYDRFVPHLLNLIKRQKEQIEAMEARLAALEAS